MKIFLSLFFSFFLCSCGKYGSPIAPEALAPDEVRNASVFGFADRVQLSWDQPKKNTSGKALNNLTQYRIMRADLSTNEAIPSAEEIAEIKAPLTEEDLPTDKRIVFDDTEVTPGTAYQYIIIPFGEDDLQGKPYAVAVDFNGMTSTLIPTRQVGGFFGF